MRSHVLINTQLAWLLNEYISNRLVVYMNTTQRLTWFHIVKTYLIYIMYTYNNLNLFYVARYRVQEMVDNTLS